MLGEILFAHIETILGKPDCLEINQYNCFAVYDTTIIRLIKETLIITAPVIDDSGDRRWEFHLADPNSLPEINQLLVGLRPY